MSSYKISGISKSLLALLSVVFLVGLVIESVACIGGIKARVTAQVKSSGDDHYGHYHHGGHHPSHHYEHNSGYGSGEYGAYGASGHHYGHGGYHGGHMMPQHGGSFGHHGSYGHHADMMGGGVYGAGGHMGHHHHAHMGHHSGGHFGSANEELAAELGGTRRRGAVRKLSKVPIVGRFFYNDHQRRLNGQVKHEKENLARSIDRYHRSQKKAPKISLGGLRRKKGVDTFVLHDGNEVAERMNRINLLKAAIKRKNPKKLIYAPHSHHLV